MNWRSVPLCALYFVLCTLCLVLCALCFVSKLPAPGARGRTKHKAPRTKHQHRLDSRSRVHDLDTQTITLFHAQSFCGNFDETRSGPGLAGEFERIYLFANFKPANVAMGG